MLLRLAAAIVIAAPLCLGAALAKEQAKTPPAAAKTAPSAAKASPPPAAAKSPAKPNFEMREPAGGATPGKQRQKACIAEWRALSAPEKTAQGPGWPQFYSKCVKRLKGAQKE